MKTESPPHYPESEAWILSNLCPSGRDTLLLDGLITAQSFYSDANRKAFQESGLHHVKLGGAQHHVCLVADAEQRRRLVSELTALAVKLYDPELSLEAVLPELGELHRNHLKEYDSAERLLSTNAIY